jgi:hypothetical protein
MHVPFLSDLSPDADESALPQAGQLIRRLSVVMLGAVTLLVFLIVGPQFHPGLSQIAPGMFSFGLSSSPTPNEAASANERAAPVIEDLSAHPSTKLSPYFTPSASVSSANNASVLRHFHDLLQQYVFRQTQDSNFTIRVIDRRSNEVLEVFTLTELRTAHRNGKNLDWGTVDEHRYEAMERLVDKHEARGVPLEDIIVRWGRANQVQTAHKRDRGYQAYERRLAEYLGLSLLATEIGTVETFNRDHLVSTAGALSRYQMLPWVLRRGGVTEYSLPTENDSWVRVREERHPLLVLEPAFLLLRGYVNAVGHELPGLSAYHTGPGNVFKLYRHYYTSAKHFTRSSTVADAYAWAVTDGFDTVSEGSAFGSDSRGYVPALYGSLAAREDQRIDPSPSLRAARVQLKPGATLTLRELLAPLGATDRSRRLSGWGPAADTATSTYGRFRALNPHFDLPPSSDGTVPAGGNVRLASSVEGRAVQFFLPLRAPDVLRAAGIDALDSTATFRYDDSTYAPPAPSQVTKWDRQYDTLVENIAHFGFTKQNRKRLLRLYDRFQALAEQRPTRYRRRQLEIISTHRRLWRSGPWEELAEATKRATEGMEIEGQPLDILPTQTPVPDSLQASTP